MSSATDALDVTLFREDMLSSVWPEQKRHTSCIQDPPGIPLYIITGHITKGGVKTTSDEMCPKNYFPEKFSSTSGTIYSR